MTNSFSSLKPSRALAGEAPRPDQVAALGQEHGFSSRLPVEARSGKRDLGPTKMLGIKTPIPVFNRFCDFCQRERLSYWEGIKELMDRVGVRDDGSVG